MRVEGVDERQAEFVEFYESSRDACLRAVTACGAERPLAEDLVADAFARAWTSWRQVSRHQAPRACLPARQREVVAMRLLLDLDTTTTAEVLGIAPGTVTAHLSRAVTALRRDVARPHTHPTAMEPIP